MSCYLQALVESDFTALHTLTIEKQRPLLARRARWSLADVYRQPISLYRQHLAFLSNDTRMLLLLT